MYTKVLRAVKKDLCQADEDEILVPNPVLLRSMDNDHFVGIVSRRPARFGRVAVVEDADEESIAVGDQTGVLSPSMTDDIDTERLEDVRFFMDAVSEFEVGALVGCSNTFIDDEITWEIFEVEESAQKGQ